MKEMTLAEIAKAINCKAIRGQDKAVKKFAKVSTDTRSINSGDLFIALAGERFDAHDFLKDAVNNGVGAVIVSKESQEDLGVPQLFVEDTLEALQSLANYNRMQYRLPLIGITGSNGKTTTKDMVAAVLGQKFKTLKTKGNFNNEIGLPLTLLELDQRYGAAVIEMGMRGLGEIDLLGKIARPTGAIITSIGETHLERLGSIENITLAKSEILNHLDKKGFAVFNGEDQRVMEVSQKFEGKKYYYGFSSDFYCWASDIISVEQGQKFTVNIDDLNQEVYIPVLGLHNVLNSLASIVVGYHLGLNLDEIAAGLKNLELSSMRLEIIDKENFKVINDAYNANPASVKASLQILKELGKNQRTIAILGDMYELGDRTEAGHREVGEEVVKEKVDILIGVGSLAKYIVEGARDAGMPEKNSFHFESKQDVIDKLKEIGYKGDVVLIKGSRGMKMEEIIQGRF